MNNKLPESNNVYSTIASPVNLELAERLLNEEFPDARIWIYTSGYSGAKTLHVCSETANFEGYAMSEEANSSYLFNGALAGEEHEVVSKVSSIHKRFREAGAPLAIEAYGEDNELICNFPES